LLTGRNANVPRDFPAGVFATNYAPLGKVLPRSAAVVHAGGIGTCAEALRAGISSVIIPFAFDQPDNAWRLGRLGVAVTLSRNGITARAMAGRLEKILADGQVADKAKCLSATIWNSNSARTAIEALEATEGRASRP
jgi:UDP:flavonoid glycosyltransferase YjiC (YdhE family)